MRNAIGLGIQNGLRIAFDLDRVDQVALLHGVNDFLAFEHFAEYGVLAVKPRAFDMRDEELRAVGVRTGVGHGQNAALVAKAVVGFVFEAVARAAATDALRAAALDHEIGDDAVEVQAVVETALGQIDEVGDGQRGLLGFQLDLDGTAGSVELGDQAHRCSE